MSGVPSQAPGLMRLSARQTFARARQPANKYRVCAPRDTRREMSCGFRRGLTTADRATHPTTAPGGSSRRNSVFSCVNSSAVPPQMLQALSRNDLSLTVLRDRNRIRSQPSRGRHPNDRFTLRGEIKEAHRISSTSARCEDEVGSPVGRVHVQAPQISYAHCPDKVSRWPARTARADAGDRRSGWSSSAASCGHRTRPSTSSDCNRGRPKRGKCQPDARA
jgi:hypothetical protein